MEGGKALVTVLAPARSAVTVLLTGTDPPMQFSQKPTGRLERVTDSSDARYRSGRGSNAWGKRMQVAVGADWQ